MPLEFHCLLAGPNDTNFVDLLVVQVVQYSSVLDHDDLVHGLDPLVREVAEVQPPRRLEVHLVEFSLLNRDVLHIDPLLPHQLLHQIEVVPIVDQDCVQSFSAEGNLDGARALLLAFSHLDVASDRANRRVMELVLIALNGRCHFLRILAVLRQAVAFLRGQMLELLLKFADLRYFRRLLGLQRSILAREPSERRRTLLVVDRVGQFCPHLHCLLALQRTQVARAQHALCYPNLAVQRVGCICRGWGKV